MIYNETESVWKYNDIVQPLYRLFNMEMIITKLYYWKVWYLLIYTYWLKSVLRYQIGLEIRWINFGDNFGLRWTKIHKNSKKISGSTHVLTRVICPLQNYEPLFRKYSIHQFNNDWKASGILCYYWNINGCLRFFFLYHSMNNYVLRDI